MRLFAFAFFAATASCLAIHVPSAAACSAFPPCSVPFVVGAGATVPANAPGFFLDYRYLQPGDPSVQVTAGGGVLATSVGNPTSTEAFRAVTLDLSTLSGSTLAIRTYAACSTSGVGGGLEFRDQTLAVGPSAPIPTSLGRLVVTEVASEPVPFPGGGPCYELADRSTVHVELEPSDEALPWLDVVVLETLVDGRPYMRQGGLSYDPSPLGTTSRVGWGSDLFFAACGAPAGTSDEGLSAGSHRITFRASLADGTTFETPSVRIHVDCPGSGCAIGGSRDASTPALVVVALGVLASRLAPKRRARRARS